MFINLNYVLLLATLAIKVFVLDTLSVFIKYKESIIILLSRVL